LQKAYELDTVISPILLVRRLNVLAFYLCDKIPEINSLKRRKIYFGSQFQRPQPMVLSPAAFGLMVRQNLRVGSLW
jgi:hypothetical protein